MKKRSHAAPLSTDDDAVLLLNRVLRRLASCVAFDPDSRSDTINAIVAAVRSVPIFESRVLRFSIDIVEPSGTEWYIAASTDPQAEVGQRHSLNDGMTGWAIRTGMPQPFRATSRDSTPQQIHRLSGYDDVQSAFLWVFSSRGRPRGAICVVSDQANAIDSKMFDALERIGWHIKFALLEPSTLSGPAEATPTDNPPPELSGGEDDEWFTRLINMSERKYEHVFFWQWDAVSRRLRPTWASPPRRDVPQGWPGFLELGQGFVGRCALTKRPLTDNQVDSGTGTTTKIFTPFPDIRPNVPIRSVAALPVKDDRRLYGVVAALSDTMDYFATDEPSLRKIAESLTLHLQRQDDRTLDDVQRDIADKLLTSLKRPDSPTRFWTVASQILCLLESSRLCRAAMLFVGKRTASGIYTCKATSSAADEHRGVLFDMRANATFRELLDKKPGTHSWTGPSGSFRPLIRSEKTRFAIGHYPNEANERGVPLLTVFAVLHGDEAPLAPFGGRTDSVIAQTFRFLFAAARAVLTAADMARLDTDRLQVMALATHDLRSPVTAIRSAASAIPDVSERTSELRRRIIALTDTALLSIENLLFEWKRSRDARGDWQVSEEERIDLADLGNMLHELVAEAQQNRGSDRHVLLNNEFAASQQLSDVMHELVAEAQANTAKSRTPARSSRRPAGFVLAKRTRLSLAVKNVISNAIKFGKDSVVSVRYAVEQVEERDSVQRWRAKIEVQDLGIGIPPENFQAIFERGRLHPHSREHVATGAGIGLSITRAILSSFGGQIWPESDVGRGTTMHISLPIVEAKP